MKLQTLIRKLQTIEKEIRHAGGDVFESEVMIVGQTEEGGFLTYTPNFDMFVDDNNDVSIEAVTKDLPDNES